MKNFFKQIYKGWIKFGELIGFINSQIILFLLFYMIITPMAFALRILGKDLLHKKLDKQLKTYWQNRLVQPSSMKNQF